MDDFPPFEENPFYNDPFEDWNFQDSSPSFDEPPPEEKQINFWEPEFSVKKGDPKSARYPLLDRFNKWELKTWKHLLGITGSERARWLSQGWVKTGDNPQTGKPIWYPQHQSTIDIARATGVTGIDIYDANNNIVSLDRAFGRIGLNINQYNAKTEKRLSRVFRPSYAFGLYQQGSGEGQIQINDFEANEARWDGVALMSRRALELLTEQLPPAQRDEYRKSGRFAATIMDERGQMKSDLIVRDDLEGVQIQVPTGGWKKEISLDTQKAGGTLIDIRPRHSHFGDLWLDSQTHTNLYSRILPNEFFFKQIEEQSTRFLQKLATGYSTNDAQRMFFQGVESGEQYDSRMAMVPYDYLMRGGRVNESPEMMRRFGSMYQKKLWSAEGHYRMPMKEMFSMYLTSGEAAPPEVQKRLERGSVFLDAKHSAIYYHPEDYEWAAGVHGGGDQDDMLKGSWFDWGGEAWGFFHRSPNTQGEFTTMKIANPEFFKENRIDPIRPNISGLTNITGIKEKRFAMPELQGAQTEGITDHRALSNFLIPNTQKNVTVVGQYINALTVANHILGREPFDQYTSSENVIDTAQKTMGNLEGVKNWYQSLATMLIKRPMPRDDYRRLYSMLPDEYKEGGEQQGYIPAKGHWVDEIGDYYRQHLSQINRSVEQLASLSAPPSEIYTNDTDFALKGVMQRVYQGALPSNRKATSEEYSRAHKALYDSTMALPQEDRDKYLRQLLTNPVSKEGDEAYFSDKLAWLSDKNPETGEHWGMAYLTMDYLKRQGVLADRPEFGQQAAPIRVSRAINLITRPNYDVLGAQEEVDPYMDDEYANKQMWSDRKRAIRELVGTNAYVSGGAVLSSGKPIAYLGQQHGNVEIEGGSVIRSFERKGQVLLSLKDPQRVTYNLEPWKFNRENVQDLDKQVINNLSWAAGEYLAGNIDMSKLHPTVRYALQKQVSEMEGTQILGPEPDREFYDPYARPKYGTREYRERLKSSAPEMPDLYRRIPDYARRLRSEAPIRLYRGEANPNRKKNIPAWLADAPMYQERQEAFGRWFTQNREYAEYYKNDSGDDGVVSYVDMDEAEANRYRLSNMENRDLDKARSFSLDYDNEFFLPKQVAMQRRMLSEAPPAGFFKFPFELQHASELGFEQHIEGNETWYRPRGLNPNTMTERERDQLRERAGEGADRIFAGGVESNDWRGEFLRRHFGGGPENTDNFTSWVGGLGTGARRSFENAYVPMYGQYLFHKAAGATYDWLSSNTEWAARWNSWKTRYGLSEWPDTYERKRLREDQVISGVGNGGDDLPPEPPPTDTPPDDTPPYWKSAFSHEAPVNPNHPYYDVYSAQPRNISSVARHARLGQNTLVATPPGSGKTKYAQAMATELGGLNIVVSPLAELNRNLAERMNRIVDPDTGERYYRSVHLPGHPGYGRDTTQYDESVQEFLREFRASVTYDEGGRAQWNEQVAPMVVTMSPEKFANLQKSRIGEMMAPFIRSVTMDEAQELSDYSGRYLMTQARESLNKLRQDTGNAIPALLLGGTIDTSQMHSLARSYDVSEVIREPVEAKHIDMELRFAKGWDEQVSMAADFAERAEREGRKSLIYGYSTKMVEDISGAIQRRGMESEFFHRGYGRRGHGITQAEESSVRGQLDKNEIDQHLVGSSALGLGIDLKNVNSVAQVGPARISQTIQYMMRIRPNTTEAMGQGVFQMIANPADYYKWAKDYSQNTIALQPYMVNRVYMGLRDRDDFSPNWKDASDEMSKAAGEILESQFRINRNRGADVMDMIRQAGLLTMDVHQVKVGTGPDGEDVTDNVFTHKWNRTSDSLDIISDTRYTDPWESDQKLSFKQYIDRVGLKRAEEYSAMGDLLTSLRGYAPRVAGRLLKNALTSSYGGRLPASAPKAGHENIAVKVRHGDGEEEYFAEPDFTGPDSSEISITTYAKAFTSALRSGGSIAGSWHSQPTGRSNKPSQTDHEGLGQLGEMEISEGEMPTKRMRARAEDISDIPNTSSSETLRDYMNRGINRDAADMLASELEDLTKNFKRLNEQAQALTDTQEKQNELSRIDVEYRTGLKRLREDYNLTTPEAKATAYAAISDRAATMTDLDVAGRMSLFGNRLGSEATAEFKSGGGRRGEQEGFQPGDTWADRPYIARMSSVLQAMRSWRYIAEPVVQRAYSGAVDYNPIAAAMGEAYGYGTSQSGFRSRTQMAQEWLGAASYQSFAGALDLPYAMSGSGMGLARAYSGAQVGFGLATSGSEIGYGMLQNAFFMDRQVVDPKTGQLVNNAARTSLMGLGQKVWLGSMVAGAVVAGGSFASEVMQETPLGDSITRLITGGQYQGGAPKEGWSSALIRSPISAFGNAAAAYQKIAESDASPFLKMAGAVATTGMSMGEVGFSVIGLGPQWRKAVKDKLKLDREDYVSAGFSEEMADYLSYEGETAQEKRYQQAAKRLVGVYGGEVSQQIPVLARTTATFGMGEMGAAQFLGKGAEFGISSAQYSGLVENMGQQYGYLPGTSGMASYARYAGGLDITRFAQEQIDASRFSQFTSQLAPYMGYTGAAGAVRNYDINTPAKTQAAQQGLSWVDRLGVDVNEVLSVRATGETESVQVGTVSVPGFTKEGRDQAYVNAPVYKDRLVTENYTVGDAMAGWASGLQSQKGSAYVESIFGMGELFTNAGFDRSQVLPLLQNLGGMFSGYNQNQMNLTGRILQGDMGAQSYASWNQPELLSNVGMNPQSYRFQDQYGRNIWETSGAEWMKTGLSRYKEGFAQGTGFGNLAQSVEMAMAGPNTNTAMLYMGTKNADLANAFLSNGVQGMQWYMQDQQYSFQQQGFALQQDQLDASQDYTRQMWGYQDQARQMDYRSQMADFAYSRKRMNMSNRFSIQQENISEQRMNIGQEWNLWNTQFSQQTAMMQRGWQREDWGYQDQMRGLSREWGAEDLNEAIRFSTGRERRRLLRQRDRTTQTQNLEDEQIDTQRERQEQLWGREDERYKKLIEYIKETTDLDKEQFELNKQQREESFAMEKENLDRKIKEYQKQFDLETKMQEASRKYQEVQWDFQQRSLDMQKAQAEIQRDYELALRNIEEDVSKVVGEAKQLAEYNPGKLLEPLVKLMSAMDGLDKGTLSKLISLMTSIDSLDATKIAALERAFDQ